MGKNLSLVVGRVPAETRHMWNATHTVHTKVVLAAKIPKPAIVRKRGGGG